MTEDMIQFICSIRMIDGLNKYLNNDQIYHLITSKCDKQKEKINLNKKQRKKFEKWFTVESQREVRTNEAAYKMGFKDGLSIMMSSGHGE